MSQTLEVFYQQEVQVVWSCRVCKDYMVNMSSYNDDSPFPHISQPQHVFDQAYNAVNATNIVPCNPSTQSQFWLVLDSRGVREQDKLRVM